MALSHTMITRIKYLSSRNTNAGFIASGAEGRAAQRKSLIVLHPAKKYIYEKMHTVSFYEVKHKVNQFGIASIKLYFKVLFFRFIIFDESNCHFTNLIKLNE